MPDISRLRMVKNQVESDEAIVATMHPLASQAGADVLRRGGNAVDAAVAAGFAIGVVEPFNSGLGGIAQMVIRDGSTGRAVVIDGTSILPRRVDPGRYPLAGSGTAGMYGWPAVEGDANNTGYLAPAVPGTPACLCEAHRRFGRLPLAEVIGPAIDAARAGYELDWHPALVFAAQQQRLSQFPGSRANYFRSDGTCYAPALFNNDGERLAQPDLADSLEAIARGGVDGFYRGEPARWIAAAMAEHGGWIDLDEFARYRVRVWDKPLRGSYRGHDTIQAPENTGAPTVLQALRLLEGFDVAQSGAGTATTFHLIAESLRLAFLDRFEYLADPSFVPVPFDALTSTEYARVRRAAIDPHRARLDATAGDPWPLSSARPGMVATGGGAGEGNTTHLVVCDRERTLVSLTSTLGAYFGSGVVAPGTGFALNNGLTWFDPRPNRANSIAPGKRILWAGTPTIVEREGRPFLATGAPGGRRILSAIVQVISNVVDFGIEPQDAVSVARVHCEGGETSIDRAAGETAIEGLRAMGHQIVVKDDGPGISNFARPLAIVVDPITGRLRAGVHAWNPATAIGL